MTEPATKFDKFYLRIKNHPIVAAIIVLATIVIALSSFTDAAKNLLALVMTEKRPVINGEWKATVVYDWPNANHIETFTFNGEGDELQGTATFLEGKKGILEGKVYQDKLLFITKSQEVLDDWDNPKESIHRYQGKIAGDEINFTMQTEGGYSEHIPISFTARRVANPALQSAPSQ